MGGEGEWRNLRPDLLPSERAAGRSWRACGFRVEGRPLEMARRGEGQSGGDEGLEESGPLMLMWARLPPVPPSFRAPLTALLLSARFH